MADKTHLLSEAIRTRAVDLRPLAHVDETGLPFADALAAVSEFAKLSVAILGGDVWEYKKGRSRPSYENWHADWQIGAETWDQYVDRSADVAAMSIRKFHQLHRADQTLYVLVCATQDEATRYSSERRGDQRDSD